MENLKNKVPTFEFVLIDDPYIIMNSMLLSMDFNGILILSLKRTVLALEISSFTTQSFVLQSGIPYSERLPTSFWTYLIAFISNFGVSSLSMFRHRGTLTANKIAIWTMNIFLNITLPLDMTHGTISKDIPTLAIMTIYH